MGRHRKFRAERAKVLNIARDLARSGQHPNYESIVAQMESLDVMVRDGLQDIRSQLNRLCALAQIGPTRMTSLVGTRPLLNFHANLLAESARIATTRSIPAANIKRRSGARPCRLVDGAKDYSDITLSTVTPVSKTPRTIRATPT
jgi:hypothetical protein